MFNIKTNLNIRLANADNLHNVELAKAFIKNTAQEASALNSMHHLNALESKQDLNHLIWLVEHQGRYIGWTALEVLLLEELNDVYLTISSLALYVEEDYRVQGIGSLLIEQAAIDAASLIRNTLTFQTFDKFNIAKGDDAEVLTIHLDVKAQRSSEVEESLFQRLNRCLNFELESEVAELPYFVRSNLELDEAY